MESPVSSPLIDSASGQSSRSRSSTKLADDVTSLTSFNPFSEEDEHDQSSYTLVTSIFSRMKNSLSAPLSSTSTLPPSSTIGSNVNNIVANGSEARRPTFATIQTNGSNFSSRTSASERPNPLVAAPAQAAPPLVSLTPAQSEVPTYTVEYDRSTAQRNPYSPTLDFGDNAPFGTSIPGFPIQDDARSIKTTTSVHRSGSVSKVMRRLRGEGLSRDYWMDDENCKECYDCKSVFSTWRRKHHCRICGQIFCSRCASNIIKGARFGSEGMVRICNLCLDKLAKVEEDDDDDRRSVISSATTFPAHQLGMDTFSSLPHPQSPFSASQLFARDEPFNLFSIAETKKPLYGSEGSFSRPETPLIQEGEDGVWESVRDNPAPFRRGLSDEEKGHQSSPPNLFSIDHAVETEKSEVGIQFPPTKPVDINTSTSSIQFPIGSPEHLGTPRLPHNARTSSNPYGEFDVATPFIRSRVQSRLEPAFDTEPGWRTRRESTAYAQELNLASMHHLKIMLRQMLTIEEIPNIREWEETLLRLALRIAKEMTFTSLPHRQGQDMDVRRYVKIKKIPGGSPRDSEYVTGAVITKNVAHKQMSRVQPNPRVMLVTFPLEFSRVEGQYMHFGQIVRQEKEYLGNLATRIAALRPHVVLVEKSVSRLALDALAHHNIAVARTVKASAIQTIARMTQGDVFSSMDKLALEPRLGHCAKYCIQTYDHPLIPGRRKTYMRFEGCNRDMGCTIILRGGNIDTLRRIKKVTRLLTFVVRNLKLETHLWKDSVISLPSFNAQAIPSSESRLLQLNESTNSLLMPSSTTFAPKLLVTSPEIFDKSDESYFTVQSTGDEDLPNEDAEQLRLTRRIDESLDPYVKTFISVSATLRFPPPYPIRRMKLLDNMLLEAKRAWEDEVVRKEESFQSMHRQERTLTAVTPTNGPPDMLGGEEREDIIAQIEALPVSNIPTTPLTADGSPPTSTLEQDSYFHLVSTSPNLSDPTTPAISIRASSFLTPEVPECLKTVADIHHQSQYTLLKWQHEEFRRIWEWYLRKNSDDFVVEKYQCIHVREYVVPAVDIGLHRPCFAPSLNYIRFYGENDMTLGQFIDKSVTDTLTQYQDPKAICTGKGCEQLLARHCKVYVHNETALSVAVEKWEGQIIGHPLLDLVTTWSACRVCGSATPFIPVSEEMQRYSFAKFLELHFYPADIKLVQGAGCQHNIYQHHIRFFASKGMTVRFQADPVSMHEIVYPPFRIRVRPETQLDLKNADFERLHHRNMLWYTGLIDDLKLISIDAATGDEDTDARLLADINALILRAEAEREDISRSINETYRHTSPTDTLALNQIHAYRQDKIVAWQMDFDRLPKPRPIQTMNRNSHRSSAFDSVRSMWPRRYDLSGAFESPHLPSSSVSEAEELPFKSRRADTAESVTSSASDTESSTDMNEKSEKVPPNSAPSQNDVVPDPAEGQHKSDPDSDSTIGAVREDAANPEEPPHTKETEVAEVSIEDPAPKSSRLPRRTAQNLSVADLVKKYQDFLPAQGVHDLAQTALTPKQVMSESEQEYPSQLTLRPSIRSKSRHRLPVRKPSISDFEQGYAANVAPRYLTHTRRSLTATNSSRIPAPKGSTLESQTSSRRASPEKPPLNAQGKEVRFSRPSSPSGRQSTNGGVKQSKSRVVSRTKEKTGPRPASSSATKSTFRRLPAGPGSKVSNIAKHFERLGRDAERSKSRYAVIRGKRARPVASARAKVEVLDSVKDAIRDDSESSDSSSEADDEDEGNDEDQIGAATSVEGLPPAAREEPETPPVVAETTSEVGSSTGHAAAQDYKGEEANLSAPVPSQFSTPSSPFLSAVRNQQDATLTPPPSDLELGGIGTERNSILKALSGFWPQTSRHSIENDDPMSDPEHIFRDSSMVVRLDEPTSIIALALNSPQYRDMLGKSRAEKKTAREAKLSEGSEAFMPDDGSIADSSSTWGVVNVDSSDSADPTEDLRAPSSKLPWAITFESGGLTISCTVLYPEQFDALRRTYDCEKSMVESLSRCVKWNASGGKSGSAFLKTRDDRFIAKELSKPELQTMETFAPAYFDYMSTSIYANRPTLLAKVFGCYKLTFRKSGKDKGTGKSKSTQMNLLVMENLFYDRRFSKIYDLKGSTRNRHVQSTGRENEVLLDENLVETAHLNPFYLREHSKRILRGALYNDSKFLADINVMDYSLVCGVDSQNNELVVGIVDYIRTYTWDKKLESWVKESAFLGGAGRGEPTIVTPKQYRQRFISAMERYFPLIPDRWMKQRDTPEEESSIALSELWPDW